MTVEELTKIGVEILSAAPDNMVINSFAAELIGESYPVSPEMRKIIFRDRTALDLGRAFVTWTKGDED